MSDRDSVLQSPSDAPGLTGSASLTKGSPGVENSAGTLLRNARQAQGLDIDALAATLKVSTQKLQALEQDRVDLLLDPAFARALASSVCRMLKVDPAPVLQRLPPITAFKMTAQNRGINTPFRPREAGPGSSPRMQFSRPAVLLGLALLLGALVLIFCLSFSRKLPDTELRGAVRSLKATYSNRFPGPRREQARPWWRVARLPPRQILPASPSHRLRPKRS